MSCSRWSPLHPVALLFAAIVSWSGPAAAQADAAIPEATLREPWNLQLAVLQSLSGSITGAAADTRTQLANALAALEIAIGGFEVQVDGVIDRVVGNPEFSYIAAETSAELSAQLAEVHARFGTLYSTLGVQERGDVRAAQDSLDKLRRILEDRVPFERDVVRALGSGLRQKIVELATRWWNGEERAIAVKKLVADLQRGLGGASEKEKAK